MFVRGAIKEDGIDITIKNNPHHILAPNDWDMVMKVRFNKISAQEYRTWYLNLIRERWQNRRDEFMELAKEAMHKEVKLKCFCSLKSKICHAGIAVEFMNVLVKKLQAAGNIPK